MAAVWDPDADALLEPLPAEALARIRRDLLSIVREPIAGILVAPTDDMRIVMALCVGPEDTPYSGAAFVFKIRFPKDYPASPPRVKFMTTGGGSVRMGPNLYANGKVCLSILGTWMGPKWLPSFTLSTLLVSLHALFAPSPAFLEPGHEAAPAAEVTALNDALEHEVLRVAVLGQLGEGAAASPPAYLTNSPELLETVRENFMLQAQGWIARARDRAAGLDGKPFADPKYAKVRTWDTAPVFNFSLLADRIEAAEGMMLEKEEGGGGV